MKRGWRIFLWSVVGLAVLIIAIITWRHVRMNRIIAGLGKPELSRRIASAQRLMKFKHATKILAKKPPAARDNAVWALEQVADEKALRDIVALARDLGGTVARRTVVRFGERAVLALIATLQSDPREYDDRFKAAAARRFAAEMLGEIGTSRAVPALIRALKDTSLEVRLAAAAALVRIGNPQAQAPLWHFIEPLLGVLRGEYYCWARVDAEDHLLRREQVRHNNISPLLKVKITPLAEAEETVVVEIPEEEELLRPLSAEEQQRLEAERIFRLTQEERRRIAQPGKRVRFKRGPVDLEVTGFEADLNPAVEGQPVTFTVRFKNHGPGDIGLTFMVALYYAGPRPLTKGRDTRAMGGYDLVRFSRHLFRGQEGEVKVTHRFTGLERHQIWAAQQLGIIGDDRAVPVLCAAMHSFSWAVRLNVLDALGKIGVLSTTRSAQRAAIVRTLIEALGHRDSIIRYRAAENLGQMQVQTATLPLLATLSDPIWSVRQAATRALVGTVTEKWLNPLLPALLDPDPAVRLSALRVLESISSPQATQVLLAAAADPSPEVRLSVVGDLLLYLPPSQTIPTLVGALGDPNPRVRAAAARTLAKLAVPETETALIMALQDRDGDVREAAAQALGRIGSKSAVQALIAASEAEAGEFVGVPPGEEVENPEAYTPTDKDVRAAAIAALAEIGGPEAHEAIRDALSDSHPKVLAVAIPAIAELGDRTVGDRLIEILEDDKMLLPIRLAAARAIRQLEIEEAVEPLVDLLNHPNYQMKIAVSAALVALHDRRGEKTLREHLKHKDVNIRREAARTIATMDPALIQAIRGLKPEQRDGLEMIFKDLYQEGRAVYEFTVGALAELAKLPQAHQRLLQGLTDTHVLVRAACVEALSHLKKEPELVPRLAAFLDPQKEPQELVRQKAVEALARLEAVEYRSQLEKCAQNDPAEEVREAAQKALRELLLVARRR